MKERIYSGYRKALCAAMALVMILLIIAPAAAYAGENPLRFSVTQTFTAYPASADGAFAYRLKPLVSGAPMPPGSAADRYDFSLAGTKGVQIGPMNYTRQGIYKYELFQLIGTEKPGYTYDKRVYTLEVYVDSALEAKLTIKNQDGAKAGGIEFRNSYKVLPSDPGLMADPPVKKTVSGDPAKDSAFSFRLKAQDPSYPMPTGSVDGVKTINITGSGEGRFGKWSYNEEGLYYYIVSEVDAGEKGYVYDTALYTITDVVKAVDGRLEVSRVVTNDSNRQVTSMTFINKYSPGGGPGGGGGDGGGGSGADGPKEGPIPEGPKTGDETDIVLYATLFVIGGLLAFGGVFSLISGRKRKR